MYDQQVADHLPLPEGQQLDSRRLRGNPVPARPVRRASRGARLLQELGVLESELQTGGTQVDTDEPSFEVVLKLRGSSRLESGPLNGVNLTVLGEGESWTYAVWSNRDSRERLGILLGEYMQTEQDQQNPNWDHPATWATLLDRIEDIELYGADDRTDPELDLLDFERPQAVDVLLWPAGTPSVAQQRINAVIVVIEAAQRRNDRLLVLAVDPRPQSTLIRVMADQQLLQSLLVETWVERVRPPLRALVIEASFSRPLPIPSLAPPSGEAVGVIDGVVVTGNPLLTDSVVAAAEFPRGHIFAAVDSHGTGVASVASYGCLDFCVNEGSPGHPHPIVSARVLDPKGLELEVAGISHQTITDAMRWMVENHGIRVINISINRRYASDGLLRSELSAAIDEAARELDVVVVIPTGNRAPADRPARGWLEGYPHYFDEGESRIADPGDAALALTVGSIAGRDVPGGRFSADLLAVSPARHASPFTRTGPVRCPSASGVMKPEFAHVGGNWAMYDNNNLPIVDDPNLGVVVASPPRSGRYVQSTTGTSFAAPAVAHEVARLATRYPEASANLLRALTALSARPTQPKTREFDVLHVSAYGQPEAGRVLESEGSRAVLTIEAIIHTNSVVVHELPVPYDFARGGSKRTLRVALAFDPPVRRGRREYLAGQMSVQFVRGMTLQEVVKTYAQQPSVKQAKDDSSIRRVDLPTGKLRPNLEPGPSRLEWNTLIRRDFIHGAWDPDDENYYLVVTHNLSPWTAAQRRQYAEQNYALAVQLADEERLDLDLHGQISVLLRARGRVRGRVRG